MIEKGTLLAFETGEYSDYGILAHCKVLQDFDYEDELEEYLTKHPKQREDYKAKFSQFLAYLTAKGLIEDFDVQHLWMGAYSTFEGIKK